MGAWRGWLLAAAVFAVGSARAQGTEQEAREAAQETEDAGDQAAQQAGEAARETGEAAQAAGQDLAPSDARPLSERCEALIRGELAGDANLQSQCAALVRSAAGEGAQTQAAVARGNATPGQSVAAAFTGAGRELFGQGQKPPLGMRSGGPTANLLMTNPIGWFNGLGVNASYSRALERFDKLAWVGQARYSHTSASNGNVTAFGVGAGMDYYVIGRNNEGLRVGPRLSGTFGTEDFGGTTSFGMLGLSGELGYNFVASNGLAASVAGGVGGRIAGDDQNEEFENFTGGEFGPYLQLGLGYAW